MEQLHEFAAVMLSNIRMQYSSRTASGTFGAVGRLLPQLCAVRYRYASAEYLEAVNEMERSQPDATRKEDYENPFLIRLCRL